MTELYNAIGVAVSPEHAWAVLGDLTGVTAWAPGVVHATMDGEVRVCRTADGGEIREEISEYKPDQQSYRYRHLQAPLPVRESHGRLFVQPADGGATVGWEAAFEALDLARETQITAMIDGAYKEALELLRQRIESNSA